MTQPPQPPLSYYGPPPAPPIPPPKSFRRGFLGWVLFLGVCVLLFLLLSQRSPTPRGSPIALSEFTSRLESNQVHAVTVSTDELRGEFLSAQSLPDGRTVLYFRTPLPPGTADSWPFLEWLLSHRGGAVVSVEPQPNSLVANILLPLIPWLLIFGFIWFFVFRQLRNAARNQTVTITGPGRWVPDPPGPPPAQP